MQQARGATISEHAASWLLRARIPQHIEREAPDGHGQQWEPVARRRRWRQPPGESGGVATSVATGWGDASRLKSIGPLTFVPIPRRKMGTRFPESRVRLRDSTPIARFWNGNAACSLLPRAHVELRNGFIVGIFNYCDRWCDACAFTSRCRLFADVAEMQASLDPGLKALVTAPPLERPPQPPPWLAELLEEMDDAMHKPADNGEPLEHPLPPEHILIEERACGYRARLDPWLQIREFSAKNDPADPQAVVLWFSTLIPAKIHRSLHGLADDRPEDRDWPPDYDGSAKVALLGIERSHAAWLELVAQGVVPDAVAAPFVCDLVWLGDALERVFPNARAFVRPALDEPDEVLRLFLRD